MSAVSMDSLLIQKRDRSQSTVAAAAEDEKPSKDSRKAAAKKGGKDTGDKKNEEKKDKQGMELLAQLVMMMGRLTLSTAREVALIKSITMQVLLIPRKDTSEMLDRLKAVTVQYNEDVKAMSPPEKGRYPSPHTFLWLELLSILREGFKDRQPLQAAIEKHFTELQALADEEFKNSKEGETKLLGLKKQFMMETVSYQVKVLKFLRCYNPAMCRLEANCTPNSTAAVVLQEFIMLLKVKYSAEERPGQAPRGTLERRILRNMELLSKQKVGGMQMSSLLDELAD
eukprot:TRINITY_DN28091_c0_g2_i1.p2 TRINITY_DN28091_c0_g2~~TRINITY_DN28091_c0_g2_i1.p2  ORF type:complete len:284 (-),score=98.92 TRINITY_DN28091_c0_g2_i1:230-1081(-)